MTNEQAKLSESCFCSSLVLGDVLGEGEFGIVYKASVGGLLDTAVAVKTLKGTRLQ
jgi:hypothetical protein